MDSIVRLGGKARSSFALILLTAASAGALAASNDDIWRTTFGQGWFYESGSAGGVLAGTWWESSLDPEHTYRISFKVDSVRGRIGLLVGDNPEVLITSTGRYAYEFSARDKRRMVFRARDSDVTAGVSEIQVTSTRSSSEGGSADALPAAAGTAAAPPGHYWSFARQRNLRDEVLQVIDQPQHAWSTFASNQAAQLDRAFRTPGVRGFWMAYHWGDVEVRDGVYDWRVLDANMEVARRYGIRMLVQIGDRSFDRSNPLPRYFPSRYVLWSQGNGNAGYVAKRWDPYVYNRLIRLYRQIASRYRSHPAFGGIATTESALGSINAGDYTVDRYKAALIQIATQTQSFLPRGKLFLYMNFLQGGQNLDMNKDARVDILRRIPHHSVVLGGPDLTPDVPGMPGSVNAYRIHARNTMGHVPQFCHLQHVDQGFRGLNNKTNRHRDEVRRRVANLQSQPWHRSSPGVYRFATLRDARGRIVDRHPESAVGQPWQLEELLDFGTRNFNCKYMIWHYRDYAGRNEFGWQDVRQVMLNSQYFHM